MVFDRYLYLFIFHYYDTHLTPFYTEAVVQLDQGHHITVSSSKLSIGGGAEDKPGGGVIPDLGHLAHAGDAQSLLRGHGSITG